MSIPFPPMPPTDNLYKFVAITGLILMVVGFIMPGILYRIEHDYYWKLRREMVDRTTERTVRYLENEMKLRYESQEDRDNALDAIHERIKGFRDAEAELLEMEMDERTKPYPYWQRSFKFTFWSGVGASLLGFGLWWWKVQSLQDGILYAQYRKEVKPKFKSKIKPYPPGRSHVQIHTRK